ncbi:MAG: acetylxylan esterase [Planctomycetales bacterium]|nr:acetylxylan esterase [Planctomycetales bacterium]
MLSPSCRLPALVCVLLLRLAAPIACAEEFGVLPEAIDGVPRGEIFSRSLLDRADAALAARRAAYEALKTPADVEAYQQRLRTFFYQQLGELPERTPLNATATGRVARDGFVIEKILFESRPHHYVTGALFLPDAKKFPPPYPAALVVCGHSANGKAYDGYQRATALLALNGVAGFIIDPIGQGERAQLLDAAGQRVVKGSTDEHSLIGHGAALLGRNTASYEIWDGMRAIDYLVGRPDVDASRGVGCMGNSGGGTQTAYLMALDDRIACASPSCYITSFERLLHTIGPQDAEQNIFGQVQQGMNHADYVVLRAPRPTLMCVATNDFFSIDGAWDSFRQAKRIYTRLGRPERIDLAEFDGPHGWSQPLREAAVAWMARWLRGVDQPVHEPDIDALTEQQLQVTPQGQVMLLEGAVSAFDLNVAENNRLAPLRANFWKNTPRDRALAEVARLAGVHHDSAQHAKWERPMGEPPAGVDLALVCRREGRATLPAVIVGGKADGRPPRRVLFLAEKGMAHALAADGPAAKLVAQGCTVMAVDVSGVGETASANGQWYNPRFGGEGKNATIAYLLGESLLGLRAEDILAAANYAAHHLGGKDLGPVELIAEGELGPPALHAAALAPQLFSRVRIERSLTSFTSIVETPVVERQWAHVVHGALRVYDLPDLAQTLGDKLELIDPVDASGRRIAER